MAPRNAVARWITAPESEHLISIPEEDARHRKALHQLLFVKTNFQNKILCKRPVCCQLETEEYESQQYVYVYIPALC